MHVDISMHIWGFDLLIVLVGLQPPLSSERAERLYILGGHIWSSWSILSTVDKDVHGQYWFLWSILSSAITIVLFIIRFWDLKLVASDIFFWGIQPRCILRDNWKLFHLIWAWSKIPEQYMGRSIESKLKKKLGLDCSIEEYLKSWEMKAWCRYS